METSMTAKLKRVKETEDKAGRTLAEYREKAEAIVSEARSEAERAKEEMEEKARSEGVAEMNGIIEKAGKSARELAKQYEADGKRLREAVADRRGEAVAFIVEKLEEGV
jgi:vacuolar-type H+-ATPase subunit H